MRIEQDWYVWHEREPLLFDDTREHEVRNDTDQMRVVLIIDFEPRMPLLANLLQTAIFSRPKFGGNPYDP